MTVAEAIEEANAKIEDIKSKYNRMMDRIQEIRDEIDETITNALNKSKQWVEQKVKWLTDKLNEYIEKASAWMQRVQEAINQWLDNLKKKIEAQIQRYIEKELMSIEIFKDPPAPAPETI